MKISVSILCYNYGRFLADAIESVLAQDQRADILVVDDGSTDDTPEVCAAYAGRIRVLRDTNQGFAASLTRAIEHAQGDYVCLLDADDYFAPGKLARIRRELERPNVLYVDHAQVIVDERRREISGARGAGSTSSICVSRAAALQLLPLENEVALQVILKAGAGVRLAEPLGYYRVHGASMTNRKAPGLQNDYLAGIHHRLAERLRHLSPLPGWLGSARAAEAIARDFGATAHYNELEAALERGLAPAARRACLAMLRTAFGSATGYSTLHARMLVKTLLMRPSFPKHG